MFAVSCFVCVCVWGGAHVCMLIIAITLNSMEHETETYPVFNVLYVHIIIATTPPPPAFSPHALPPPSISSPPPSST